MPVLKSFLLLALMFFYCFVFAQNAAHSTLVPLGQFEKNGLVAHTTDSLSDTASFTDTIPALQNLDAYIAPKAISLRSVVVPVAMISYGALTFTSKDLKSLNLSIRDGLSESTRKHVGFDDYSKYIPAAAVYGLNLAGIRGRHNLVDATLLYGLSNLIGSGIVASTKRLTDVVRPDSSNRLSFPSGHTAGAFIAAEFLRQEYKDVSVWYGVAGYAVAAGTGFLRMYNNKHWLNDVVAGAGVGILSTRIAYWPYPKLKNTVFKKTPSNTLVAPTYQQGAVGIGLVHRF